MLASRIESILFISTKPISIKQLAKICVRSEDELEVVLESLKNKFNNSESGIHILTAQNEIQMVTNPNNRPLIEKLIKEEVTSEITTPQLETLTIISYRGPITKLELEQIRGVNCGLILRNLLIKGLINVKEDKIIDNNNYTVSFEFMRHLGINSIEELPDYAKLSKTEKIDEILEEAKNIN